MDHKSMEHISPEATMKGCDKCSMSNVMPGIDGDMLWNVRRECKGDEDSDTDW